MQRCTTFNGEIGECRSFEDCRKMDRNPGYFKNKYISLQNDVIWWIFVYFRTLDKRVQNQLFFSRIVNRRSRYQFCYNRPDGRYGYCCKGQNNKANATTTTKRPVRPAAATPLPLNRSKSISVSNQIMKLNFLIVFCFLFRFFCFQHAATIRRSWIGS